MITIETITLEGHGVRLEPLSIAHHNDFIVAASDGKLWELWYTTVPHPDGMSDYIATALEGKAKGHMLPWAVRDLTNNKIVGSTRYHDIVSPIDRVEIGYTWYAKSRQRSHINTACKFLLLSHAFETLHCKVVGLRTDNFNFTSQKAIEGLGAKKDGILRHHQPRRDASVRDTHMYSILASEWTDVKRHLQFRMARHEQSK